MNADLSQGLTFLAWTAGGFLIIVGIFLIKLLFDLSRLTISLKKSADIVQTELNPIMKNVSETTQIVNDFIQTTNKRVKVFTEVYDKLADVTANIASKASKVANIAIKALGKGFIAGIKSLIKKR